MFDFIPDEKLRELSEQYKDQYQNQNPFPFIYFDNFFQHDILNDALAAFPALDTMDFYKYDNPLEKKFAFDQLNQLPEPIAKILVYMNSAPILKFLENLTGIKHLIPDPYLRGGGIHQIPEGGKLDVHIDFNFHQQLQLYRRVNLIIFLNKDWEENYGGHLEMWDGYRNEQGKPVLTEMKAEILPVFDRVALFSTSEKSYHGHPRPLACPADRTRKSIALYYYTATREDENVDAHSTTFVATPDEANNKELEALREQRNKGRLSTNVSLD